MQALKYISMSALVATAATVGPVLAGFHSASLSSPRLAAAATTQDASRPAAFAGPLQRDHAKSQDAVKWKIYRNSQYGFQLSYAPTVDFYAFGKLISGMGEDPNGGVGVGVEDFDQFSSIIGDHVYEDAITYDRARKKWRVALQHDQPRADALCPDSFVNVQGRPYYIVSSRNFGGGSWVYAYVTKSKIIMIQGLPEYLGPQNDPNAPIKVDVSRLRFDNPEDVIAVGCEVTGP